MYPQTNYLNKLQDDSPPKEIGMDYYQMNMYKSNRFCTISPEQPIQYNFATQGMLQNSSATPGSKEGLLP